LARWNTQIDRLEFQSEFGKPFVQKRIDGRPAATSPQGKAAVWGLADQTVSGGGRYRLEGKVKTRAVSVDPGDRRVARVSHGHSARHNVVGTVDWTSLGLDFVVPDGLERLS
jgi:hypothetical protein